MVELRRAVLLRAAESDGLVPVVRNRTPLPEEVLELFAELRLGRATSGDVGVVVWRNKDIKFSKRARLYSVDVLRPEEVEPDEHHHVVGGLGRAVAKPLKTGNFFF